MLSPGGPHGGRGVRAAEMQVRCVRQAHRGGELGGRGFFAVSASEAGYGRGEGEDLAVAFDHGGWEAGWEARLRLPHGGELGLSSLWRGRDQVVPWLSVRGCLGAA